MKISYSKMSSYFNCPRKFYLDYVLKKAVWKDNIHTIYGTSVHETCQLIIKNYFNKELKDVGFYIDFFNQYMDSLKDNVKNLTNSKLKQFREYGIEVVKYFHKNKDRYYGDPMYLLKGIEFEHEVEYKENISIFVKIDVLVYDKYEDILLIDDLKTSMRGWGEKQKKDSIKKLQLLFYKFVLLWDDGGFDNINNIDLRFIVFKNIAYAPKGVDMPPQRMQKITFASGKSKMKEVKDFLDRFIEDNINEKGEYIDRGVDWYECKKSNYCDYCEYKGSEFCSLKK